MVNKEVSTDSILKGEEVSLVDAILVAKTKRDGFTETHEGRHFFQVKEEEGKLKVYPVVEGQDSSKPTQISGDHIIEATEESVVIVAGAIYDPSNELGASSAHESLVKGGINAGVLTAFNEYAKARYRLGSYNDFLDSDTMVILPEETKPVEPDPEPVDPGEPEVPTDPEPVDPGETEEKPKVPTEPEPGETDPGETEEKTKVPEE